MSTQAPSAAAGDAAPARRAAVLAGGAGSRMGGAKATAIVGERALISHPIAAIRLAGLTPFVVAKASTDLPPLRCSIVIEPEQPLHPLAGVIAALEHAEEPIIVVACDLPLLPAELIAELGHRRARFAMPAFPRAQPLVARYTPGLLPRLREALESEEPLTRVAMNLGGDALGRAELRGYGDPESMFANVNSPADVQRVEARLSNRTP